MDFPWLINIILHAFMQLFYTAMDICDDIVACFTRNLSMHAIIFTYWYLFFVEFPRYYLLDIIVSIKHKFDSVKRDQKEVVARMLLFAERPLVSIIVPGKNEGKHIFKLANSLREQTYQNFEIIVIDDGSDDATPLIGRDMERNGFIDHYIRMSVRGGKASAANCGLNMAKGKYLIHLDADSSLDRNAIEKILIPFYVDKRIKGVGGCVKVRNMDDTICTSMQAVEYLKTIMVGRMVTSDLGIYHIISGAFGAFETEALRNVGGWDIGPGLDGDITQKLRKAGNKVVFANEAICLTNVPTQWHKLFKQRTRWSRSLVRFRIRKHFDMINPLSSNFNFANFFSNMESIVYDFLLNYLWVIYIVTLLFANTDRLLEIFVVGWLIRFVFSLMSFAVIMMITERRREELHLIKYLGLSTLYTGYFLRLTRLVGHTSELFFFKSYKDAWNPRKTSVIAQLERQ
jgi:biofilm PGA synthesis N-glycosyltransferase PgaC